MKHHKLRAELIQEFYLRVETMDLSQEDAKSLASAWGIVPICFCDNHRGGFRCETSQQPEGRWF
jgi:hypothetical protein